VARVSIDEAFYTDLL